MGKQGSPKNNINLSFSDSESSDTDLQFSGFESPRSDMDRPSSNSGSPNHQSPIRASLPPSPHMSRSARYSEPSSSLTRSESFIPESYMPSYTRALKGLSNASSSSQSNIDTETSYLTVGIFYSNAENESIFQYDPKGNFFIILSFQRDNALKKSATTIATAIDEVFEAAKISNAQLTDDQKQEIKKYLGQYAQNNKIIFENIIFSNFPKFIIEQIDSKIIKDIETSFNQHIQHAREEYDEYSLEATPTPPRRARQDSSSKQKPTTIPVQPKILPFSDGDLFKKVTVEKGGDDLFKKVTVQAPNTSSNLTSVLRRG